jgi:hypothetical protein
MPDKRLLSRQEAASYCGMSVPVFERVCPIAPLDLGDTRLHRWDIERINAWIDGMQRHIVNSNDDADEAWLAKAGQ